MVFDRCPMEERENLMRKTGAVVLAILACILALAVATAEALGQTVDTLSFEVEGIGVVAGVGHDCPIEDNGRVIGYVGFEVECPVWVIDPDGDRTLGTVEVQVADSSRIEARIEADTLLYLKIVRKGNSRVTLIPHPTVFLAVRAASMPWDTLGAMDALQGQENQFCAYLGGYSTAYAKSYEPIGPPCPEFGGKWLPEFPVKWSGGGGLLHWYGSRSTSPGLVMARIDLPVGRLRLIRVNGI